MRDSIRFAGVVPLAPQARGEVGLAVLDREGRVGPRVQARDHAARAEHEGKEEYITLGSCTRFVTVGLFVEMRATAGAARRERGVPSASCCGTLVVTPM